MKFKALAFLLFILSNFCLAQDYKPLNDPTKACSYTNPNVPFGSAKNYFFVVEKMPSPDISISTIEKHLNKNIASKGIASEQIIFQTLINCEGIASNYQLLSYNPVHSKICQQVLEIFQEHVKWKAGVQRNKNVDVLIKVAIIVENGKFKIKSI